MSSLLLFNQTSDAFQVVLFPSFSAYSFRFIPVCIHNRAKREAAVSWSQPELGDAEAIDGGHEQLGALYAAAEGT